MLYIIPAVYLCSGPHPLLMATTAPGAPPLHRCMFDFSTTKQDWKSVQNLNMDLISKSANRVWFWFVGNIVLQRECVTTQYFTTMCTRHCLTMGQQDHITGFPYRVCFCTRVGIKKVGKLTTSIVVNTIRIKYWNNVNTWTMCGHLSNVTPLYIWRN